MVKAKAAAKASTSNGSGRFQRAGYQSKRRLIVCSMGLQKVGKTNFGFTGPAPLAVIDIDGGLGGVIEKFQNQKEIYYANYGDEYSTLREALNNGDAASAVADSAERQLARMREDYRQALTEAKTVLVDTGGELYEIVRLAAFGRLDKVMGREYGPVNREMKMWVEMAKASDANVIFSHRLGDEYINDKKTGGYRMEGWKKLAFEAEVIVQQWKEPKEPFPERYHATIVDCRLNPEMEGEDLSGEMATFPVMAAMILGGSPDDFI